jgi:molybdenum cofactor biosynthesis enzyme MoaA
MPGFRKLPVAHVLFAASQVNNMVRREVFAGVAEPTDAQALSDLQSAFLTSGQRFVPEDSPFTTLFADITHRCNMACRNCYIPVRDLPDLPVDWLYSVVRRLPRRTRIRLVGAEPTMRDDLPAIIAEIRRLGHIPVILSNGLKLGQMRYASKLKAAGLHTVYISLNGGLRDDLYEEIDGLACAPRKLQALANLLALKMNVTTGTIIVPDVNDGHIAEFIDYLIARRVPELHFRSVGKVGNYMEGKSLSLDALEDCLRTSLRPEHGQLELQHSYGSSRDFKLGTTRIQLTEWPELGSLERGRITPNGFVEPMFESMVANAFSY